MTAASRMAKTSANLFHASRHSMPGDARTGCRRLVSGSRGVPSATARTRPPRPLSEEALSEEALSEEAPSEEAPSGDTGGSSSGGISWVVPAGSSGTSSPQTAWPAGTSAWRATYSVRPDTRI